MLRALLFDFDETLFERQAALERFHERLLDRCGIRGELRGDVLKRLVASDRENHYQGLKTYSQRAAAIAPELNLSAEQYYDLYVPGLLDAILPEYETIAMLGRLSARFKLAVVTNGSSARQREKLRRTGLIDCFVPAAIFVSEEVGKKKPDPLMFRRALEFLNCAPQEALFCGDDPERDINAAASLGMAACWVNGSRPGAVYPTELLAPNWTVHRVGELERILGSAKRPHD